MNDSEQKHGPGGHEGDHGGGGGHGHEVTTILVNGQPKRIEDNHLSYAQLVRIAFPEIDPRTAYTVTYDKGPKQNPEGSMSPGDTVKIQNGMVFNVTPTGKS